MKEKMNNLTSVTLEDTRPTDEELEVSIKEALQWDPDVDPSNINISVVSGLVTLTGTVDSYWKKIKAEGKTAQFRDVIGIINDLVIVPKDRVVDQAIARDISQALDRDASVNPDHINIEVRNGKVVLTGNVWDRAAYETVEEIIQYVPGVADIQNDLIIA